MNNPRLNKILRDIWGSKTRSLLAILSIAVGVFAIGLVIGTRAILVEGMTTDFQSVNPSSAIIETTDTFNESFVEAVARMNEIEDAEGRAHIDVRYRVGNEWRNMRLYAVKDFDALRIDQIKSETGAWPPSDSEVLIERNGFDRVEANLGDMLVVENRGGQQRELKITGTTHEIVQAATTFTGINYGYITFDTFESLGGKPSTYNQIHLIVAENKFDRAHIQRVVNLVQDRIETPVRRVARIRIQLIPGTHTFQTIVESVILILGVLGVLTLLLSGFLVVNTVSALLAQQIRQIGIMKTFGADNVQIMGIYLPIPLLFGTLAMVIAIPLAALGARALASFLLNLLNFNAVSFNIPIYVIILQAIVSLAVPLLASLYPISSASQITIRQAIDSHGGSDNSFGMSRVDQILNRVLMAFRTLPRYFLLSLRNTFRRKRRMVLVLTTLTLGSAIFMGVLSVRSSALNTLDNASQYWQYDVEVNFQRSYRIKRVETEALRVPGIVKVEGWGVDNARRVRSNNTESVNLLMVAPPAQTELLQPILEEGRWLQPEDENQIVIDREVIREEPDITLGDSIVLKIQGREQTLEVVGIVQGQLRGPTVYINYPYFAKKIGKAGHLNRMVAVTEQHDPDFRTQIAVALETQFEYRGLHVSQLDTTDQMRSRIAFQFNIIVAFLAVMAILLSIVGGIGLTGTMGINILERRREIGIMRAIGASPNDVILILIIEGTLIGLLSWLIGVILSWPLSRFLSNAVGMALLQSPLHYAFSVFGILLWLVIIVALAAIASYLPARNASQLSVREVLAYE